MLDPLQQQQQQQQAGAGGRGGSTSTLVDLKEVNESHLYHQDRDVVYVCVIHGKKTSLVLCAIEWVGALVSFALVADVGVPAGSELMFIAELLLFVSCWFFLLPAFVKITHALKRLVFIISVWGLALALFLFVSSALAGNAFDQCQGVDVTQHVCSKLQAAISITFITSFATMGSFLVLFLGSIKPPEMTFKSYIKANLKQGSGGEGGEGIGQEYENVPLSQVRASPMRPSQKPAVGKFGRLGEEEEGLRRASFAEDAEVEEKRLDAFEII